MNENPYDILGVPRDASLDEVKKAYRKKARENHPDLNPNDTAAADRMNKINEAYDRIINPDKYAKSDARKNGYGSPYSSDYNDPSGGYGGNTSSSGGPRQNPYGGGQGGYQWVGVDWDDMFGGNGVWGQPNTSSEPIHPEAEISDSPEIRQAINLINAKNYAAAIDILSEVRSTGRNARWYYISALANNGAGNSVQAIDQIRRAQQMDPNNADYKRAERSFTSGAVSYEQESANRGFSIGIFQPAALCCCFLLVCSICNPYRAMYCCF